MALLKQSTVRNRVFKMVNSVDHFTKQTGASPVVNLSKNAAAFGAAAGAVSEIANGWYSVALSTVDTNTLGDLAYYITGTGADDTDFCDQVMVRLPDDLAFPATSGRSMVIDAAGLVDANMVKAGPTGSGTAQTARDIGLSVPGIVAGASGGLPTLDASLNLDANVTQKGTAQAGAANTLTLAAGASAIDNTYNGNVISIMTGTGLGQSRTIIGYVGSTKVATTGRNWVTNPDATSVYKIHGLSVPRVDDNLAVTMQSGTGTGQLDFAGGVVKANLAQILGTALTETAGQLAAAFKKFFNIATPAATMDHGILVDTVTTLTNLPAIPANWLTAAGIAASALNGKGDWNIGKTGYALSAAGVQAIWDALTAALTAVGSIGKKLADWVVGTSQTGDSFARLGAPASASVSADVAAVKVDTAAVKVQTDKLTFTVANKVDGNVKSVNDVTVTGVGTVATPWGP